MSAIPAFEIEGTFPRRDAEPSFQPTTRAAGVHVPRSIPLPVPGSAVQTIRAILELLLVRTAWFLGIGLATYLLSALTAQVLLEKTRMDTIRSTSRAQAAQRLATGVHRRVEAMLRPDRVEAWAASEHMGAGG
jgi:hypothetical protein